MKYESIKRVANGEDVVLVSNKRYTIRFSAKHAQHIKDNYNNLAHGIGFMEIVNLLKESVVFPPSGKKWLAVGRFGRKVYETYFYLHKDRIDVVSSFQSNKIQIRQIFEEHEKKGNKQ